MEQSNHSSDFYDYVENTKIYFKNVDKKFMAQKIMISLFLVSLLTQHNDISLFVLLNNNDFFLQISVS